MNDRDCESCKKFSRNDPHESEGYCEAKRTWVDPQEGEDCKMHEFTLHSATKYKDGTTIMSEPDSVYATRKAAKNSMFGKTAEEMSNQLDPEFCEFGTCPYYDKFCDHTLQDKHGCAYLPHTPEADLKYLEQVFTEFARTQDDIIAEYDETLKTHGDTLEEHLNRICELEHMYEEICDTRAHLNDHRDKLQEHDNKLSTLSEDVSINEGNIDVISSDVEDLQRKVYQIYQFLNSVDPDFFAKIEEQIHSEPPKHNCNNFCGNCSHVSHTAPDEMWRCILSGEPVDPDDSSCTMFEPPF